MIGTVIIKKIITKYNSRMILSRHDALNNFSRLILACYILPEGSYVDKAIHRILPVLTPFSRFIKS